MPSWLDLVFYITASRSNVRTRPRFDLTPFPHTSCQADGDSLAPFPPLGVSMPSMIARSACPTIAASLGPRMNACMLKRVVRPSRVFLLILSLLTLLREIPRSTGGLRMWLLRAGRAHSAHSITAIPSSRRPRFTQLTSEHGTVRKTSIYASCE